MNKIVAANGGEYAVGTSTTYADIVIFHFIDTYVPSK